MRSSVVNGLAANFRMVMTGPDERQRRDDGVDAGAVGQAGVDHRRRLVHAAPDRGDDPVDDAHDVVVVLEDDVRQLELARALDVDLARAVDHDFRDGVVTEERLQRPEADDLVGDLLEHADALGAGEGQALLVDDPAEDLLDLAPDLDLVGQVELRVQVLDDAVLDPELDVPERLARRQLGDEPRRRRRARRPPLPPSGWTSRPPPGPTGPAGVPRPARPAGRSRCASAVTSTRGPPTYRNEKSDLCLAAALAALSPGSGDRRRGRRAGDRRRRGAGCPATPAPRDC